MVYNIFDGYLRFIIEAIREKRESSKLKENMFKDDGEFYEKIKQYNDRCKEVFIRNRNYLSMLKKHYKSVGRLVIECRAKTFSRLLCDTSSPFLWIPDEIGLAWDPILDTPVIPASEIKGVLSAVMQFHNETLLRDLLFGGSIPCKQSKTIKSIIDITDAYPVSGTSLLERDVMTPIYAKNIEEHLALPTPINFYVISPGVEFEFLILIDIYRFKKLLEDDCFRKKLTECGINIPDNHSKLVDILINRLKNYLEKAFEEWGIGAKTSSGYGRFQVVHLGEVK